MASDCMTFRRFGRSYHLKITDVKDLEQVLTLEEALWVATGAPVDSMNCDPDFLHQVDSDKNGRIMCSEVRDAIKWLFSMLKDRNGIRAGNTVLETGSINTDTDEGRRVFDCARRLLKQAGAENADKITLDQVRNVERKIESAPVSEAGTVIPEASSDDSVKEFITDVISTVGGVPHPSGKEGINISKLNEFIMQAKKFTAWHKKGLLLNGGAASDVMPLGSDTPKAFKSYVSLRDKVDQYFGLCKAVSFDAGMADYIGSAADRFKTLDLTDPKVVEDAMKRSLIAKVGSDAVLHLDAGINPFYAEHIERLKEDVIRPLIGDISSISINEWHRIKDAFAGHEKWLNEKSGMAVEKLGVDKLGVYLSDGKFVDCINRLIRESCSTALVLDDVRLTEKLILYQAGIFTLVNNLVSFPHLYDPLNRAAFEMGTLIIDGRYLNFSIKVNNRVEHSRLAKTSDIFIVYAEISPSTGEKYEIAVPVTSGTKGNLCLGKRGVFRDIRGRISDARIVEIIENPISVGETIVSPFQRLGRLISGKIEALTLTAEKKLDAVAVPVVGGQAQGAPNSSGLLAGGLLMGGGVALAALGSALAYMANTLKGVDAYKIIIGIIVAILAVIMPASVMAMLKLRRRDLSAILEGSGWAINTRMRLTFRQGRLFTQQSVLPKGSRVGGSHSRSLWIVVWLIVMMLAGVYLYIALRKLSG